MSVWTINLGILTLRPSVIEKPDRLVIRNSFLSRLLKLFCHLRRVDVVPDELSVTCTTRWFYLFSSSITLPFGDLAFIDYHFDSMGTEWGFKSAMRFGRHDQFETFVIELVTKDRRRHLVGRYRGEGSVATGWTGVLIGDDKMLDLAGTQERESKQFAEYLSRIIDIPIGEQSVMLQSMQRTCPTCGRLTSKVKPICIYCGSPIVEGKLSTAKD